MEHINLVYFSAAGTTKTVATTIADNLNDNKKEYDLLRTPPKQSATFGVNTPAVFAVPVYSGRIPPICVDILKKFKGNNTPAVAVVVYGNRDYDDALLELTDILKANNFIIVAAAAFVSQHSIFPIVAGGRPDNKDIDAIKQFSQKCKKAFEDFSGTEKLFVKGNTPYCEPAAIPIKPTGNSKCNACGTCVKICPTKAISAATPRKTDKSRCISCTACISVCPQNARNFGGPLYALAGKAFVKKNSSRREPDFFYAE